MLASSCFSDPFLLGILPCTSRAGLFFLCMVLNTHEGGLVETSFKHDGRSSGSRGESSVGKVSKEDETGVYGGVGRWLGTRGQRV